jgi:CheY-like chemotaxis protein
MRKVTVLHIEDSGVDREIVRQLLEAEDFTVISTASAKVGIELAKSRVPDIILVDYHLPDMDGCDVAMQLRMMTQLRLVPIIAISATVSEEELEQCDAHFDGFIEKPIDADTFPRKVLELVSRGRSHRVYPAAETKKERKPPSEIPEDAREALQSLEKIRAALSHDLRTPLTVMISYANTVGREKVGDLNEKQREMLDLVVDQGFQMDALISELVRIARESLDNYDYLPKEEKGPA